MGLQLAPTAQILVFFISSKGELIADSLKLEVDNYFANKVAFQTICLIPLKVFNQAYLNTETYN